MITFYSLRSTVFPIFVVGIFPIGSPAVAQVALPDAKPVPRMQATPLPGDQTAFERDGTELARYHFSSALRRPFVYPLLGPSGRSLTRMGHPRDPHGHRHHNSVWISHNSVAGVDFWGDEGQGRIVTRRIKRYEDSDAAALLEAENAWIDGGGKTLLTEERRLTVTPLDGKEWLLTIDLTLAAGKEPVMLGKSPFGMLGVRMAKTIGVHDGGGLIRNSEGARNEKEVFWKRARWVDYSGPITPTASEGVTLFDHPANPNHPSYFHVRDDGWMGASLTFEAPMTLEPGKPLALRYGLFVHAGVPEAERIEGAFKQFAKP